VARLLAKPATWRWLLRTPALGCRLACCGATQLGPALSAGWCLPSGRPRSHEQRDAGVGPLPSLPCTPRPCPPPRPPRASPSAAGLKHARGWDLGGSPAPTAQRRCRGSAACAPLPASSAPPAPVVHDMQPQQPSPLLKGRTITTDMSPSSSPKVRARCRVQVRPAGWLELMPGARHASAPQPPRNRCSRRLAGRGQWPAFPHTAATKAQLAA